jgi:hypothetical protein
VGAPKTDLLRAQIGARLGLIRALTLGAQPHVGTRKLGCQALRPPLTRIELSLGRRRAGDRSGVSVLLLRAMAQASSPTPHRTSSAPSVAQRLAASTHSTRVYPQYL